MTSPSAPVHLVVDIEPAAALSGRPVRPGTPIRVRSRACKVEAQLTIDVGGEETLVRTVRLTALPVCGEILDTGATGHIEVETVFWRRTAGTTIWLADADERTVAEFTAAGWGEDPRDEAAGLQAVTIDEPIPVILATAAAGGIYLMREMRLPFVPYVGDLLEVGVDDDFMPVECVRLDAQGRLVVWMEVFPSRATAARFVEAGWMQMRDDTLTQPAGP